VAETTLSSNVTPMANLPITSALEPLSRDSFGDRAYTAIRDAIGRMNIYDTTAAIRLDERELAQELGVSRTPIREALVRLEKDGFVRSVPRRGYFVVRKSKREIIETIMVWAALESMAARIVTTVATDEEIASLRSIFATFESDSVAAHIDEYSDANLDFHQRIVEMAHSSILSDTAAPLFVHMRAIRHKTITENRRFDRSIIDHIHIIEALEQRDQEKAERLVRDHALNLAEHVEKNVHYLP
jgi:DNA-binding GntR family transcriptional regulator